MPEETVTTPTDDGGVEVEFKEEQDSETPEPMESINLVPFILKNKKKYVSYLDRSKKLSGEEMLAEMGKIVREEYNIDKSSRTEWEENTARSVKLFSTFMRAKNYPWPNSSNVCLPFLSIASIQFQARAYDALIPAKEVVKVLNTDFNNKDEVERADRVGKYMNYQLLYKMDDFEENMDKTLMQLPLEGSVFKKTYYDAIKKRNVSEYISAFDFVMNYKAKNLDSAERKTHVLYFTVDKIRKRVQSGIFRKNAWDLKPGTENISSPIQQTADEAEGKSPPAPEHNQERILLEQHRDWDLDGDGIAEPYVITVDYETEMVLRITDRRTKDSLGKEVTIEHFTEYIFIPNPEGSYGLGFGTLISGLNESANSILNEIIDAGALANLQGGFFLEGYGLKGKDFKFERGVYKGVKLQVGVNDIRKLIYDFDFKGPSQSLFAVLGLLFEYSKLVSSVSETMTGQLPASDTPATTVLALIEEGRKVFSAIHKRAHRSFKKELKKNYRLNSIYLDEREYFQVLGETNMPTGEILQAGRADFVDTYDVIPVSDPIITSRSEKVAKAQAIVQDVRTNPLTAGNQEANYIATKRYYEALEIPNVEELLKNPEPPDLPPEEENAGFLMEKPAVVLPTQDHAHHLEVHKEFLSPEFAQFSQQLTPAGQKLSQAHVQEHTASMYLAQEQALQEQADAEVAQGGNGSFEGTVGELGEV